MTKAEKHEVAVVVRNIINDECDEIRKAYQDLYGNLKGLRSYVHKECVEFWSSCEPYLDKEYQDIEWMKIGKRNINLDGCWCYIRDGLKFELRHVQ